MRYPPRTDQSARMWPANSSQKVSRTNFRIGVSDWSRKIRKLTADTETAKS